MLLIVSSTYNKTWVGSCPKGSQHITGPFIPSLEEPSLKTNTLTPFLALTFSLTWGLAVLLFLFYDQIVAIFGEVSSTNPLFILAVYSPAIAGVFLVLLHFGLKGLGSFLRRLTLWRAPAAWWLFLILSIPLMYYAGAALSGNLAEPFPFTPWYAVFPALVLPLFLGPIEEFGWRGLALPLLQRKFAPFWAGLILGVIWALWHIPAFLIGGTPQSSWSFVPYFAGLVALSIIITPMFNASRGSLLLPFLFHFQLNNPMWPDAQPWDALFFVLAAAVIVVLNRKTMFQKGSGVTEVLMPGEEEGIIQSRRKQISAPVGESGSV
ncbi:MAG: CPBP family intramembrane metalloprotease [Chloroflexi bacterium]|nr:MAG: CPBP family intramembrane metalloprotease [Chloroflexota bacterium]